MSKEEKNIRQKNIRFRLDNPTDRQLLERLDALPSAMQSNMIKIALKEYFDRQKRSSAVDDLENVLDSVRTLEKSLIHCAGRLVNAAERLEHKKIEEYL